MIRSLYHYQYTADEWASVLALYRACTGHLPTTLTGHVELIRHAQTLSACLHRLDERLADLYSYHRWLYNGMSRWLYIDPPHPVYQSRRAVLSALAEMDGAGTDAWHTEHGIIRREDAETVCRVHSRSQCMVELDMYSFQILGRWKLDGMSASMRSVMQAEGW